jgi:hypothetical protein
MVATCKEKWKYKMLRFKRPLEKPRHRCGTIIEANLEALKM